MLNRVSPLDSILSIEHNYLPLSKNVLIVDSNTFVAKKIESILKLKHHISHGIVSCVHKVEAAIKKEEPNVIIINIETQGELNGYQIGKLLKLDYEEISLIILYREENSELKKWAEELNPDGFIPFSDNQSKLEVDIENVLF